MTSTNHTPFSESVEFDATGANLNAPLAQLDAAIGDMAALTTTDKTSVKNALNEVDLHADNVQTQLNVGHNADGSHKTGVIADANLATDVKIGSLAAFATTAKSSVQAAIAEIFTRLAGSIDVDGTLKAGAVDREAAISAGVVTNGNLATDVKVGSLASLSTTVKSTVAGAINELFTRLAGVSNADGTLKDGAITDAKLGSDVKAGSLAALSTTIKSSLQGAINEIFTRLAGSVDADGTLKAGAVDGYTVIANGVIISDHVNAASKPGYVAQLHTVARASFQESINELADFFGSVPLLQNWRAKIGKVEYGDTDRAILGFLGDQWVQVCASADNFINIVRTRLQTRFGNAGAGWVTFVPIDSDSVPPGVTISKEGTWEDTVNNAIIGPATPNLSLGPCLRHTRVVTIDSPTPQKIFLTADVNAFVIHYWKLPGGGDFRYRIDSGAWTTVTTDYASAEYGTVTISGMDGGNHPIDIEPVVAGSAGLILIGIDCQLTAPGVRVHNLGSSGSTSYHWAHCNQTALKAGFTALGITSFALEIGNNEMSVDLDDITADQTILVTAMNTVAPLADIVLIAPADNGTDTPTLTGPYSVRMAKTAFDNGCAFFSLYDWFGPYASDRGMYADAVTLSLQGQSVAEALLYKHIFSVD